MFFIEAIITGSVIGIIGFFLFEKLLGSFLHGLSFVGQILAICILGILFGLSSMSLVVGLASDLTSLSESSIWLFLTISIFFAPIPLIVLITMVYYKIQLEGHHAFADMATGTIGPLVGTLVGFTLSSDQPQEGIQLFIPTSIIAMKNIFLGVISGGISGISAFITQKLLKVVF